MEVLTMIISLLSKTQGRDKTLRLIQYATLSSSCHKGVFTVVNNQVRTTRKILRFLRTLQFVAQIRKQIPESLKHSNNPKYLITKILLILEHIFGLFFHIADHRMCLSQFGLLNQSEARIHYEEGMKFYHIQKVIGVFRNFFQVIVIAFRQQEDDKKILSTDELLKQVKPYLIDMLKCLLDTMIVRYYQNKSSMASKTAQFVGVFGVITSIISICQILKLL